MDPLKKNQEGALANLLNKKNALKPIESISSLFSQKIPSHQEENPISSNTNMILELPPYIDENASALMNKNRAERTLFVGNIDIKATKKEIKRLFKKFGEIEAIWERSLPLNDESKIPMKAKAIVKDFSKTLTNQTKNCYILFTEKESTFKGLKANNELLLNRHLRVDLCERKEVFFLKKINF